MDIDQFFDPLWRDYTAMTVQAQRIQDAISSRDETGKLYQGFGAASADTAFESTDTRLSPNGAAH